MGQAVRCREQGCAASVWMARHGHGVCRRCPSRIRFQGVLLQVLRGIRGIAGQVSPAHGVTPLPAPFPKMPV